MVAQQQCMLVLALAIAQQQCMLALMVDDCSEAIRACFHGW